jgi:putative intracellular protease/amidase
MLMGKKNSFIFIILAGALVVSVFSLMSACKRITMDESVSGEGEGVHALLLVSENYGLNYFLMRDVFDQFGWKVTHTGVLESITACPPVHEQLGIHPIIPDVPLSAIDNLNEYDCLIIPPGSGNYYPVPNAFGDLLENPEALSLIKRAVEEGLTVFTICSGSRVLAAADVLRGKKMVGSPRFVDEYEAAGAIYLGNERNDSPPVIDGNIVTGARGQYYNRANCQAIATVIESQKKIEGKRSSPAEFLRVKSSPIMAEDLIWAKTYGGSGADGARAVCICPDNGFLITGYTFSQGTGDADVLVIRTDSEGNMLWSGTYGGVGTEYGNGSICLADGFLVAGYTTSFGSGTKDVYLIKLDKDGREVWSQAYGGPSWDVGMSVCATNDDHYIVCGYTHSFGKGEEDVYLIKTDRSGKEIWSKTYGGERLDMGNSVCLTDNDGFLVGATSGSFSENTDFLLIRTDAQGNELWKTSYGAAGPRGHGFDWCNTMISDDDGGALLAGYTDCQDVMDIHVIKTDRKGNEMWSRTLGNKPFYDFGNAICEAANGDFLVLGTTKTIVKNEDIYDNDIYLARMDPQGNIIEEKRLGGFGVDWASSVVPTGNGDYVVAGHTTSSESDFFDVLLLRIGIDKD